MKCVYSSWVHISTPV